VCLIPALGPVPFELLAANDPPESAIIAVLISTVCPFSTSERRDFVVIRLDDGQFVRVGRDRVVLVRTGGCPGAHGS
jgi:hypothetical protein